MRIIRNPLYINETWYFALHGMTLGKGFQVRFASFTFSSVGTKPQQHASTWTDTWIWFKAAGEPQPVRYRDRGTDNNAHCSLFRTIDCKMLAACRLNSDKGKTQNKVLTTGVNKALFSKTFTNGGLCGSLGNFLKILLPRIYKTQDKWDLLSV